MSDIPAFPYKLMWEERSIRSIANLTRKDAQEFLQLVPKVPIESDITLYPLEETNAALNDLRHGQFEGSAVISMS